MHEYEFINSRWRISQGYKIQHKWFGDKCAIYHCGSGDTHLLERSSFRVLEELNRGVCSFSELLEKLKPEFNVETAGETQDYLQALLSEFQNLSIVERLDT